MSFNCSSVLEMSLTDSTCWFSPSRRYKSFSECSTDDHYSGHFEILLMITSFVIRHSYVIIGKWLPAYGDVLPSLVADQEDCKWIAIL